MHQHFVGVGAIPLRGPRIAELFQFRLPRIAVTPQSISGGRGLDHENFGIFFLGIRRRGECRGEQNRELTGRVLRAGGLFQCDRTIEVALPLNSSPMKRNRPVGSLVALQVLAFVYTSV